MTARCSVCRRPTPRQALIEYGNDRICTSCKPEYFQRIQEGVEPRKAMKSSPRVLPQPYPTLSTVMFILDIVFCAIGVLGLIALFFFTNVLLGAILGGRSGANIQLIMGLVFGIFILYLGVGIVADILLLQRKKSGVILGWIVLSFGALQIVLGIVMALMQEGPQAKIRLGLRFPFFILWAWGLLKAQGWMNVPSNMQRVPLYQPTARRRRPVSRRRRPRSTAGRRI